MVCYIDDMFQYKMGEFRTRSGRLYRMSHLVATSLPELYRMVDKIGVERRWLQDKMSGPHFDITMNKRELAVQAGAVEVTMRELAAICWCLRHKLKFKSPTDAKAQMLKHAGFGSKRKQHATSSHRGKAELAASNGSSSFISKDYDC